jgi:hypothetical protein
VLCRVLNPIWDWSLIGTFPRKYIFEMSIVRFKPRVGWRGVPPKSDLRIEARPGAVGFLILSHALNGIWPHVPDHLAAHAPPAVSASRMSLFRQEYEAFPSL